MDAQKTDNWEVCSVCKRKWLDYNLEFEFCPDCIEEIRARPRDFNAVKIEQLLKYGDFRDDHLAEVVRMIWNEIR